MSTPSDVPPARPLRVLVVEDEPRWRELLVDVIPDMGFAARGVGSAEEALRVMAIDAHDILILDLHLPSMSGIDLLAHVRRRWPTTQGIILTAYGDLSVAQRGVELGIAAFLTKPCHLSDIEIALDRGRQLAMSQPAVPFRPSIKADAAMTLEETERRAIADALARHHDNKSAAARELGISRRSLYDRLEQRARHDREAARDRRRDE